MNSEVASIIWGKCKEVFLYQESIPFVFSGLEFWVFFGIFLAFFSLTYRQIKIRNWVLLLFSLYFYYRCSGASFFLFLYVITQDFLIGKRIQKTPAKAKKLVLVTVSIVLNLSILAYFKYAHFIVDTINSTLGFQIQNENWIAGQIPPNDLFNPDSTRIILPIGISFYIFQSLSYTIDSYRGQVQTLRYWHEYALFVSFFPQLVAGPIVRAKDFIGQMFIPYNLDKKTFGIGLFLILGGLIKKIVISDVISTQMVDRVFDSPALSSSVETWFAFYGYGIQIFCDFSGYTDIAIGMAMILGFHLNPNFDQPYKSLSITEFWRRWHISLSIWLRDYLYIPLGGNRNGKFKTYLNLLITMLLGGLWHGANLKFILWGGLHGFALALDKGYSILFQKWNVSLPKPMAWFLTFHFVLFCWIPFRANDFGDIQLIVLKMIGFNSFEILPDVFGQFRLPVTLTVVGFLIQFLPDFVKTGLSDRFSASPFWLQALATASVLVFIYQFKSAESQPFIYFQF